MLLNRKETFTWKKDCIVIEDAIAGIKSAQGAGIGKIFAIASLEPIEFYKKIEGIDGIINNFYEFDTLD